ncbi:MAG: class I SAM-dependent methyltransferase [Dehalococcoidia bacterium]
MATETEGVKEHYRAENLAERVLAAAAAAGITTITPEAFAPVDQFHSGGILSTRALAEFAGLQAGEKVIDLGSGLGGPTRVLASEFGCDVTGIDLSPEFIEAARTLTERCGLSGEAHFQQGDALALPFADGSFDVAWTQHVVMNINDRQTFYSEAARVLKPGGRLAFFDILFRTPDARLDFPQPWARTPDISFVYDEPATKAFLSNAGLVEESWLDVTQESVMQMQQQPPTGAYSLEVVLGEDLAPRIANVAKAMMSGQLMIIRALFRKPG